MIKGKILPKHFMLIAIMPLLLDLLISALLFYIFPSQLFIIGAFVMYGAIGATSDLWMFISSLKYQFVKGCFLVYVRAGQFKVVINTTSNINDFD